MKRARIEGVTLEYEVSGMGEPVVFIHGGLIADTFRPLVKEPRLAGHCQLITYHRRGYAGSSHPGAPISVGRAAADCRALLAHLRIGQAHVVGHSYGGAVALQLAVDFPSVVHSLALLEPAFFAGSAAADYREALLRSQQHYREAPRAVVVEEFFKPRFGADFRARLDTLVPGAFAQAVADAETFFEREMPGLLEWTFGEHELRQIKQPVLAVVGGESVRLWPRFLETQRVLLAGLPHAEAFVLPGANHGLHLQNPHDMAEALAAFHARHPLPVPDEP